MSKGYEYNNVIYTDYVEMRRAKRAHDRQLRERQLFRKLIISAVLLVSLIIITLFITSGITAKGSESLYTKEYKSIYVETGDTLWSIAKDNYDKAFGSLDNYINEIKNINGLASNQINTGEYIVISYYKAN